MNAIILVDDTGPRNIAAPSCVQCSTRGPLFGNSRSDRGCHQNWLLAVLPLLRNGASTTYFSSVMQMHMRRRVRWGTTFLGRVVSLTLPVNAITLLFLFY